MSYKVSTEVPERGGLEPLEPPLTNKGISEVGRSRFFSGGPHGEHARVAPAVRPLPFFVPGASQQGAAEDEGIDGDVNAQVGRAPFFAGGPHGEPGRTPPAKAPLPFFNPGSQSDEDIVRSRVGNILIDMQVGESTDDKAKEALLKSTITVLASSIPVIGTIFAWGTTLLSWIGFFKGKKTTADRQNKIAKFQSDIQPKIESVINAVTGNSLYHDPLFTQLIFGPVPAGLETSWHSDPGRIFEEARYGWSQTMSWLGDTSKSLEDRCGFIDSVTGVDWPNAAGTGKAYMPEYGGIANAIITYGPKFMAEATLIKDYVATGDQSVPQAAIIKDPTKLIQQRFDAVYEAQKASSELSSVQIVTSGNVAKGKLFRIGAGIGSQVVGSQVGVIIATDGMQLQKGYVYQAGDNLTIKIANGITTAVKTAIGSSIFWWILGGTAAVAAALGTVAVVKSRKK